jgi:hypothetical protein
MKILSQEEELISKLNSNLHFLSDFTTGKIGKIVYDAMLHIQNTPGGTVEHAISYINYMADMLSSELDDYQEANVQETFVCIDDLPF